MCGTKGVLYTMHGEDEPEIWYQTSTARVTTPYSTSPVILGLAGSWIQTTTGSMSINLWRSSYDYAAWHLTTDCLDLWDDPAISDYYTPSFPVLSGYRYKFHVITTIPSVNTRLYWSGAPSDIETCQVSDGCQEVEPILVPENVESGLLFTKHREDEEEGWLVTQDISITACD
jgi:hypothetical protein